ncbi:MAG: FKBP-type peptidyl-prolyl cis-trans isomerase [Muribaculaceae bacterium]|nr:FKBP-type peptidyl-prolyl cis-trans isomerase [Muribaculaceae bacterium]
MDKLSYAWGIAMASQLKGMGVESLDIKDYCDAVKAVFDGTELAVAPAEAQKLINEYITSLQERASKLAEEAGVKAKAEGEKFLTENGKKEGVHTTSTGLQYRIIKEGEGKSPAATDSVTVHYTGKLLNGTVFDSSVSRGEPATFPLNQVIPGWTEGLQLMKEGGKFEFYIPSDLAYGPHGAGGAIPPHSTLIFEVELIKVNK